MRQSLKWKTKWADDHPLIQGLRRGLGCHHEGLPHRYRVAVELMFRTGDLTVVFATQTLAQGIHAPARSGQCARPLWRAWSCYYCVGFYVWICFFFVLCVCVCVCLCL